MSGLSSRPPRVLFICTGNICRSPTAHALLLHKARAAGLQVAVDSAALSREEWGRPADERAVAQAQRRGVAMPERRARQVTKQDFATHDHVIGMTRAHCDALRRLAPGHAGKVEMLMAFAAGAGAEPQDVPDPWYGGEADFAQAFDMIEAGVDGLLELLSNQ